MAFPRPRNPKLVPSFSPSLSQTLPLTVHTSKLLTMAVPLIHTPYFINPLCRLPILPLLLLLGGDTKAYKETSQWKIKTNKEVIMKMRQQSKEYRTQLAKSKAVSCSIFANVYKLLTNQNMSSISWKILQVCKIRSLSPGATFFQYITNKFWKITYLFNPNKTEKMAINAVYLSTSVLSVSGALSP